MNARIKSILSLAPVLSLMGTALALQGCLNIENRQCGAGYCPSGYECNSATGMCYRCGDGVVDLEAGEQCDCGTGDIEPGPGCLGQQNSAQGGLCREDCTLHCGDGDLAPDEECEGSLVRFQCTDVGYDLGHMACLPGCGGLDRSNCRYLEWTRADDVSTRAFLNGIWGSGPDNIFAVGAGSGPLHYDGTSWQEIELEPEDDLSLLGVWGADADTVFAVGAKGAILQYEDETWQRHDAPGGVEETMYNIWGSGSDDVYAVGDASVVLHFDGNDWKNVDLSSLLPEERSLWGVWGTASDNIYISGENLTVLHYNGREWQLIELDLEIMGLENFSKLWLNNVWGTGPADIFAVGHLGLIMHYNGDEWQVQRPPDESQSRLYAVWGSSADDVFAAGADGALLHYDGTAWTEIPSPTTERLYGLWGSSQDSVYAVGVQTILRFGGAAITEMPTQGSPVEQRPEKLNYLFEQDGVLYAVGQTQEQGGALWKRDSDGWRAHQPGDAHDLRDTFVDANGDVWAVGARGNEGQLGGIWRLSNDVWSLEHEAEKPLNSIWARSNTDIFAVGADGVIVRYDGDSWKSDTDGQEYDLEHELYDIWGLPGANESVWAVGSYGLLLQRDNTGTWKRMATPTRAHLDAIWGSVNGHNDDVFAVGHDGTVLHGFLTEEPERMPTPSAAALTDVAGVAPDDVYAVGDNGALWHYNGDTWAPWRTNINSTLQAIHLDATGSALVATDTGDIYRIDLPSQNLIFTAPELEQPPLSIPDGTSMACHPLPTPAMSVGAVQLDIGLEHPRAGDLTVTLQSPSESEAILVSRPGDGDTEAGLASGAPISFRDDAQVAADEMGNALGNGTICQDGPPCEFSPGSETLASLAGEHGIGNWRVCVDDGRAGQAGSLHSLALSLSPSPLVSPGVCGNGVLEYGETCDDDNDVADDGCTNCRIDGCGDGIAQEHLGEECDDGNRDDGDGCSSECISEYCGNRQVDNLDEQCDPPDSSNSTSWCIQCQVAGRPEAEPNQSDDAPLGGSGTEGNNFNAGIAEGPYTADTVIRATLEPAGDEDIFAVENTTNTEIEVRFDTYNAGLGVVVCDTEFDTVLHVRDASGTSLALNDDRDHITDCSGTSLAIAPGQTVYVHITEFGDDEAVGPPGYWLVIDFQE